jgi:lysine 2,3-aminomutase
MNNTNSNSNSNDKKDQSSNSGLESEEPPSGYIKCYPKNSFFSFYFKLLKWNNWKWQLRNSIKTINQLKQYHINIIDKEKWAHLNLPFSITPYYSQLLHNPSIYKSVTPSSDEQIHMSYEECDSLHESDDSPCRTIVHRYPDRVLFLVTNTCATNCRYCTRSRMVGKTLHINWKTEWIKAINYISTHTEIRDVLISGGDPLTLIDNKLEWLLKQIRNIKHVEIIRIGTKVPVVLPMRITHKLCRMLKKYHPLFMNIHFIHPEEITPEVVKACNMLANSGIPLGSQTVLLKDINDTPEIMTKLFQKLLFVRVKPYYLYACDLVQGTSHFRTSIDVGLNIIEHLRGWTTGMAIPQFVVDAPEGGGKIPILPDCVIKKNDHQIVLCNYENKQFTYHF